MKLILLHGDHSVRTHDRLMKFVEVARSRGWDVYRSSESKKDLSELLSSDGLFNGEKLVIADDVRLITKKFMDWYNGETDNLTGTFVVYHTKPLSKTFINQFNRVDANEEFKLPNLLWKFLDSLKAGEPQRVLQRFHGVIEMEAVEFVFAMVARQFRDMYMASTDCFKGPEWRAGKLKKQGASFDVDVLKEIIRRMAEIDVRVKSSKANLTGELDLLFASF